MYLIRSKGENIGQIGKTCPRCGKMFTGNKCPYCGYEILPTTPSLIKKE